MTEHLARVLDKPEVQNRRKFKNIDLPGLLELMAVLNESRILVKATVLTGFLGKSRSYTYRILRYLKSHNIVRHEPYAGYRLVRES